jgi:prepilin-type N-terminal cleavage/methylation domain-containing protein
MLFKQLKKKINEIFNLQKVRGKEVDQKSHKGFTLIELLITVAIVAVLMTVTVVALNPAEYLKKSRDIKRITDLTNLQLALQIVAADKSISMGVCDGTKIYASVPSETPLSNDNLPSGVSWVQVSQANLMKTNGTGWIPIDFNSFASKGIRLPALPIDPKNSVNDYLFYTYTCNSNRQFVLTAWFESQYFGPKGQDPKSKSDSGPDPYLYEVGSNLFISPLKPVGSWSFDEGSGTTAYDSSGNSNNGTLVNGPTWTIGKIAGALNYSGNQYTNFPDNGSLSMQNNITIELWFYPSSFSTAYAVHPIRKWSGTNDANYVFYYFGDYNGQYPNSRGVITFYANAGGTWKAVSPSYKITNLNNWYYLTWAYNTNQGGMLYLNSNQTGSLTGSGNLATNTLSLGIGADTSDFNGIIDQVNLYNRVLSPAEIKRHYELSK